MDKKKYFVIDFNGVWYNGKFYGQGSIIELSDAQFASIKEAVKLAIATDEQIKAYEDSLKPVEQPTETNSISEPNNDDD